MTLVVDASLVAAALADGGPVGSWAESLLGAHDLAAPHLMSSEVTDIRFERRTAVGPDDEIDLRFSLAQIR